MNTPASLSAARILLILSAFYCLGAGTPIVSGPGEKLPPTIDMRTLVVSGDGIRYAYIKRTVRSLVPVVDGQVQQPADWISNNQILFSADSKHTLYVACGRKNARMVVDGVAGPVFDSVDDRLFSPRGRVMYLAQNKGMSVVVCDRAERAQLARARLGALGDVADAVAFVEMGDTGEQVYRDNHGQGVYQRVADVRFSPDGRRLAYRAQQNGRWMIVVDGVAKAACDDVSGPAFSEDSGHLGWLAARDGKTAMVLDDVETPLGPAGELSPPTLSRDGRAWLAAIRREGKMQVYRDGKLLGVFGAIASPVFSPDGRRLALVTRDDPGRARVVLDGQEMEAADYASDLQFSLDSKRFAFVAAVGKKEVLRVDRKVVGTYDGVGARTLAFCADGRSYAAVVKQGDGQHIVYDGGMTERFDAVVAGQPLCIDAESRVHAFVVRDGRLMGVTLELGR